MGQQARALTESEKKGKREGIIVIRCRVCVIKCRLRNDTCMLMILYDYSYL